MANPFEQHSVGRDSPFQDGLEVTPDDATDLATVARGLWIGAGGTLRITTERGTVLNFASVSAGLFPFAARRVHATGTTATGIVAGW